MRVSLYARVRLPELAAGRVQLRLMKRDIICGVQHLDVRSSSGDMVGLSQLYLHALHLVTNHSLGGEQSR